MPGPPTPSVCWGLGLGLRSLRSTCARGSWPFGWGACSSSPSSPPAPSPPALGVALGLAAFLGHVFPLFAHFRGGKGVATLCGVALALHPGATLVALGLFALVLLTTRYVSLGSMLATLSYPLALYFLFHVRCPWLLGFGLAIAILVVWTHRANIARLLRGQESRFAPTKHGSQGR